LQHIFRLITAPNSTNRYYADYCDQYHDRHVFHLEPLEKVPDYWDWIIKSEDQDNGLVFCYFWVPFTKLPEFAGGQGDCLDLLNSIINQLERNNG